MSGASRPSCRFATVADGEPAMRRLVEVLHGQVLPHLDEHGSLDGYRRLCQQQPDDRMPCTAGPALKLCWSATATPRTRWPPWVASPLGCQRARWLTDLAADAERLRRQVLDDATGTHDTLLATIADQQRRRGIR